jgi:hypothetical protein
VFGGDRHGTLEPRVYRVIGGFESQHEHPSPHRGAGVQECLGRVQQPAIRRV